MRNSLWTVLAALLAGTALTACAPLMIGGAAVVVADKVVEKEKGGDGLF